VRPGGASRASRDRGCVATVCDGMLTRLGRALVPGGVAFLSFKYGDGEGECNGHWYSSYDQGIIPRAAWVAGDVGGGARGARG